MPKVNLSMQRLRRLYKLSYILNENVLNPLNHEEIFFKLSKNDSYNYCRSTLEKDIFTLKIEFDYEIINHGYLGICIQEKIDFFERLENLLI